MPWFQTRPVAPARRQHPGAQHAHRASGSALSRRRLAAEVAAFAALAVLTAWSAVLVKSQAVEPLVLARTTAPESAANIAIDVRTPATGTPDNGTVAIENVAFENSGTDLIEIETIEIDAAPSDTRWFNGRPVRPARTIWMRVTAYSPDAHSCAPFDDGYTATMKSVYTNGMRLVAADPRVLPMYSMVSVPGYAEGQIVPVLDKGGKIKGNRLDVLYPTHRIALGWGVQDLAVTVWEFFDPETGEALPQ